MTTFEKMDRRLYRKFIAEFGKNHAKSTVSKFNKKSLPIKADSF